MKRAIAFLLALSVASQALALPTITAISGTAATGSSLFISGSGFGTKTRSTAYLWADAQESAVAPHSTLSNQKTFTIENMTVTSSSAKRWGNASFASTAGGTTRAATFRVPPFNVGASTRYLASWWEKSDIDYLPRTGDLSANWKAGIRIWANAVGNQNTNHYFFSITAGQGIGGIKFTSEVPTLSNNMGASYGFPSTTWRRITALYQMNSSAGSGNGIYEIRKNNTQVERVTNWNFYGATSTGWPNIAVFQHVVASPDEWPSGSTWWVTDAYLDDSWNRVEIGNASTYAACTQLEIQPYTAWSANSITINQRHGTITGSKWVYVCDESDNCNTNGYVLTSGGNPAPTITGLSPTNGPADGGTIVFAFGTNFVATPSVTVGGVEATGETFFNSTTISYVNPAGTGSQAVVVINPDSQAASYSSFTYDPEQATINPVEEIFPWVSEN